MGCTHPASSDLGSCTATATERLLAHARLYLSDGMASLSTGLSAQLSIAQNYVSLNGDNLAVKLLHLLVLYYRHDCRSIIRHTCSCAESFTSLQMDSLMVLFGHRQRAPWSHCAVSSANRRSCQSGESRMVGDLATPKKRCTAGKDVWLDKSEDMRLLHGIFGLPAYHVVPEEATSVGRLGRWTGSGSGQTWSLRRQR